MIQLKNVAVTTHQHKLLLENINLTIKPGEVVAITGPSGSGKTTLGRLLNGLIPHFYEGEITGEMWLRHTLYSSLPMWEISKMIGSVFQDPKSQFFTSTVEDELAFELENHGEKPQIIQQAVEYYLTKMHLQPLRYHDVLSLSSGQKQQVAIASTQLIEPSIFIMDEPSANLDLQATQLLQKNIQALKQQQKTIIIIEHRLDYLLPLADRILYMNQAQITAEYSAAQFQALQSDDYLQLGLRLPTVTKLACHLPLATTKQALVTLDNLTIAYKRKHLLLQAINATFYSGEVTALIGKNGSGKTTLARTLMGLHREQTGKILWPTESLPRKKRRHKTWFVMQDAIYQLFTDSVWHEVLLNQTGREAEAEQLLRDLHLWHKKDAHPAVLSGGEKQRLVLAIGLMQQARLFILDEPTSGLDGQNLRQVASLIQQLAHRGCHVLVITHDPELIALCCHHILAIKDKSIQQFYPKTYDELVHHMYFE